MEAYHSHRVRRNLTIDGWNVRLYFWSRNVGILLFVSGIIMGAGIWSGLKLQTENPALAMTQEPKQKVSLEEELKSANPDPAKVMKGLRVARFSAKVLNGTFAVPDAIQRSALPADAKSVALAYWDSLWKYHGEPSADLLYDAYYVHPLPLANELLGDLSRSQGKLDKAQLYYDREIHLTNAASARKKKVDLLLARHDMPALGPLATDPQYKEFLSREATIDLAAHDHRWVDLIPPILGMQREIFEPIPVILAIVAGLVWMAVGLQALQPPSLICFRTIVPWLAILAGMASTLPTLFGLAWESEVFGLRETGDLLGDLWFYVAGVGVREELMKLLLFLPFVPILLIRKSRLEMLVIAGFVGLGFAIDENLLYFHHMGPRVAFGRVLTANFLHFSATGLIGLALCEALRAPLRNGPRFLGTLILVILAHGCYDGLMGLIYNASMAVFLLLSLCFFRQLGTSRDGSTDQISISATLILGLAVLEGTIFVCASAMLGFPAALGMIAGNIIPLVMIVYMFYWQLGEGISEAAVDGTSKQPAYAI